VRPWIQSPHRNKRNKKKKKTLEIAEISFGKLMLLVFSNISKIIVNNISHALFYCV
jgi:hypothetical protein